MEEMKKDRRKTGLKIENQVLKLHLLYCYHTLNRKGYNFMQSPSSFIGKKKEEIQSSKPRLNPVIILRIKTPLAYTNWKENNETSSIIFNKAHFIKGRSHCVKSYTNTGDNYLSIMIFITFVTFFLSRFYISIFMYQWQTLSRCNEEETLEANYLINNTIMQ